MSQESNQNETRNGFISNNENKAKLIKAEVDAKLFISQIPFDVQRTKIFGLKQRLDRAKKTNAHRNVIFGIKTQLALAERRYEYQLDSRRYWNSYNTVCTYCDEIIAIIQ